MINALYYWVGFLNILIPSSLGWIDLALNFSNDLTFKLYGAAIGLTFGLEVLSCIFLADALRRIKKTLGDQSSVVFDTCSMVLYLLVFMLFIVS